jgi:phosphohistidine phosphatase
MVELLVLRHAKTERGGRERADVERRLLPVGRADAEEIGLLLVSRDLVPQIVLSSAAVRARETADFASVSFRPPPIRFDLPELYNGDASGYLDTVSVYGGDASRVLLVGHNPDIASFVSSVAERDVEMKPGALAVIEADATRAGEVRRGTSLRFRMVILPSGRGV